MNAPLLRRTTWRSPLGEMSLWASERGLVRLDFLDGNAERTARWARRLFGVGEPALGNPSEPLFAEALGQLAAYFGGTRRAFELPLDLRGTPFQLAVWMALRELPWGTTSSYGALARQLGRPLALRAVGAANGANPLSIIVPCHRLLAADGSLHAYGGGIERKARLLALEGVGGFSGG